MHRFCNILLQFNVTVGVHTITKTHRFIDIDFVTDPDPKISFQAVDEDRKTD